MSLLREKTREIIREGEASRKIRPAEGRPYEIYRWWLQHSEKYIYRENFCHYWRVVLIWAPLLAVRLFLERAFQKRAFVIAVLAVAALILTAVGIAVPAIGGLILLLVGVCVATFGFVMGIMIATDLDQGSVGIFDATRREKLVFFSIAVVVLPLSLSGFIVYWAVELVTNRSAQRFYRWFWEARLIGDHVSPLHLLLIIGYGAITYFGIRDGWWGVSLTIALICLGAFVIYWAIDKTGPVIAERRDLERVTAQRVQNERYLRKLDPVFRLIFANYHSHQVMSEPAYLKWRARYINHVEEVRTVDVWTRIYEGDSNNWPHWWLWPDDLWSAVQDAVFAARMADRVVVAQSRKAKSNVVMVKLKTILDTCGDFVILLAQMIRVKKWGICPIMELPDEA